MTYTPIDLAIWNKFLATRTDGDHVTPEEGAQLIADVRGETDGMELAEIVREHESTIISLTCDLANMTTRAEKAECQLAKLELLLAKVQVEYEAVVASMAKLERHL